MKTLNAQNPLNRDNFVNFTIKGNTYYARPVKNYIGYFVTTCGQVISLIGSNTTQNRKLDWSNPQILKGKDNGNGYLQVLLYSKSGFSKWHLVHRLVAITHLEKPNSFIEIGSLQINHLNQNRKDNHARNLAWTTPAENVKWNVLAKKVAKERKNA